MDFSIDILNLGKADATIIWAKDKNENHILILDGGEKHQAPQVIKHYEDYIAKHVGKNPNIILINTHIHSDHIGGLEDIVKAQSIQKHIKAVYFNNPANGQTGTLLKEAVDGAMRLGLDVPNVERLNECIVQAQNFSNELARLGITEKHVFSDSPLPQPFGKHIRIVGPSADFYAQNMRSAGRSILLGPDLEEEDNFVNEQVESVDPCRAIQTAKDRTHDNKVSVMLELTDSKKRRYLFTADASAPSFESAMAAGYLAGNYHFVQLPHHGSRGNMDAKWITHFAPNIFWVAAPGTSQHPRKALIDCIKRLLPSCKVCSTHRLSSGWMNYTSDKAAFPPRANLRPVPTL